MSRFKTFLIAIFILVVLAGLALLVSYSGTSSDPTALVSEISRKVEKGDLMVDVKNIDFCPPESDVYKRIVTDEKDITRMYQIEHRGSDMWSSSIFFYDTEERLRIVLIEAVAVNDTAIRQIVVLDKTGSRIREEQILLEGPGYSFPETWPEDKLIKVPRVDFEKEVPACQTVVN